jgi:hypothetical protein
MEGSYDESYKTPENLIAKKLDEATSKLSDAPRNGTEREWWRDIMARATTKLKAAKVRLTNADKQALLWFNIKDLFKLAGSPQRPKADYLDAVYALVHKVKKGKLPGLEEEPVQRFQQGGFVQGATQPPQPAFSQGATQPPDAPTGDAFTPMPQETGQVNIPANVTNRNVRVTHYGYEKPGEPGYDKNSARGIGDRDNMLTYDPEGITSVALSPSYRLARFGREGPSTGTVFPMGDRLFRDDDTTSSELKDHRIDIFDPNKEGTGFPDTVRVTEGADLGRNIPVPPR